ncbi:hypothetical protein DI383_11885 [Flavobacteriaceae bacterium LYZ1037]|nr:hypothetical protein DI383_11885 [Flavobacteriaceae bacterium LYZ1037]
MKKITLLMVCLLTTIFANAQWNSDTAINTLVSNSNAGDTQSVVGSNDYTYIVFWKSIASPTNYELRIQILDDSGNQLLGADGSLISNTIPMSTFTQVWSLILDDSNNVYIGLTGTAGNVGRAFKLDSNGNNLWTSNGLDLGTAYTVRIQPLPTDDVLISKLNGSNFNGEIQKYDSDGAAIWANPTSLGSGTVPANLYELSNGDFISVYHVLGSGITSTMYAQRFNDSGVAQWANPTQLFASGNNTAYNTTYFGAQDGDNIYYSYKLAHDSRFDAYVQRINPDGTLPWGITGMDFDIRQTNYEQEIQIAYQPGSTSIWALCRYTDAAQGQVGIYIQSFDKTTGARQLTDNAKAVYTISNLGISPVGNFRLTNSGQPIFLTAIIDNSLNVNLLDSNGDFVWTEGTKPLATSTGSKSRINFHAFSNNDFVTTFVENRTGTSLAYAQNFTDNALSINEVDEIDDLQFINPITNRLELKSNHTIQEVSVYNTLGQLINKIEKNNSNTLTIDSENWNPGMYLVHVKTTQNKNQVVKIIKE